MPGARLTRRMRRSVMLHRTQQILTDAALVSIAFFGAFWLVFNSSIPARFGADGIPPRYEDLFWTVLPFAVVGKVAVFALFGSYSKWWRYTDSHDFRRLVQAVLLSSLLLVGGVYLVQPGGIALPRSVAAFDFLLTLLLIGGSRFLVRSVVEKPMRGHRLHTGREILIVGAGDGGQMVAREMLKNPELGEAPIGFIDDDPRKAGARMVGLKVLGRTKQLPQILEEAEPDEVIIAIPSAPGSLRENVVSACRERNIPVRTLPTVFELLRGDVNLVKQLREVQVEDILGRDPIIMQLDRMG
ncbi:MAG: nucleoside-diphosphate sugar epimerase/dehydratase, partial [Solirubrobacterales bacterium]